MAGFMQLLVLLVFNGAWGSWARPRTLLVLLVFNQAYVLERNPRVLALSLACFQLLARIVIEFLRNTKSLSLACFQPAGFVCGVVVLRFSLLVLLVFNRSSMPSSLASSSLSLACFQLDHV